MERIFILLAAMASPAEGNSMWKQSVATVHAGKLSVPVVGSDRPIPQIGFGTCCRPGAKGPQLIVSAKSYLELGGRHIDTAHEYGNHRDLAIAIRESEVPREELWVTSKVTGPTSAGGGGEKVARTADDAEFYTDKALKELGLDYLNLMLLNVPAESKSEAKSRDNVELWKGLIQAQKDGKVKNIGVSNFNQREIEVLQKNTGVLPSVLQLEYHPWVDQASKDLVQWCKSQGIAVVAYHSIKGGAGKKGVTRLAKEHGKTPAQILLKWATDQGVVVIPGATSQEHIGEMLDLGEFRILMESLGPKKSQAQAPAESSSPLVPDRLKPRRSLKGLPNVNQDRSEGTPKPSDL